MLMVVVAEVSLSFLTGCMSNSSAPAKPGVPTPRTPCGLGPQLPGPCSSLSPFGQQPDFPELGLRGTRLGARTSGDSSCI